MSLKTFRYANMLGYRESTTGETHHLFAPASFLEEFWSLDVTNRWTARDTNAATETAIDDASSGAISLTLTNANEAQLAGLDLNNHRPFVLNQKLIAEIRFRFTVLPTGSVGAFVGIGGDHNAALNSVAERIGFRATGSGAITCETDDGSVDSGAIASGVTLIANQWAIGRIEIDTTSAVRFYLDGTRKASATTFNASTTPTLALQPVLRIGKESAATTVGTMQVDYFRAWQKRS